MSADEFKAKGNAAFAAKNFPEAIENFSSAIELDSKNHVLFSNRSACHASLKQYQEALKDAETCIGIKEDWAKGYTRKGAACHGLGDLQGACDAYEKALELEPSNAQAKSGMASVDAQMKREMDSGKFGGAEDPFTGFAQKLNDPAFYQKMAANPQTSPLLADPSFMAKLEDIKRNPSLLMQQMGDQRMIAVLGLLLGQDIGVPPKESEDSPMREAGEDESDKNASSTSRQTKPDNKAPEPKAEPEPAAAPSSKASADEEKALGNKAYANRSFDEAITHYDKAYELHQDITYLTNKAAALYESGRCEDAIKVCQDAIEQGREARADFKLIAKAFGRMGSANEKLGDLPKAIDNYQRSLTEHRTPETLKKLKNAEAAWAEKQKKDYESPEKAEKERVAGNAAFKNAEFPVAVKHYTEMIKRAPHDARGYANRAAAYIKLMSMPEAVKDADAALKIDPTFVKAYIRKATAFLAMREYSRASTALEEATVKDTEKKHTTEIRDLTYKVQQALYDERSKETEEQTQARINSDPEIMSILQEPVMQSILQQAQSNPASLGEHMRKNAAIGAKIQKLIDAGVIRTR